MARYQYPRGAKYIVCHMHRVRAHIAPRLVSVTLTRQIGSDKLISFTGDLGDLRIPKDPPFDILHAPHAATALRETGFTLYVSSASRRSAT